VIWLLGVCTKFEEKESLVFVSLHGNFRSSEINSPLMSIIVVAILIGFFSGIFIAVPAVYFVNLTDDKSWNENSHGLWHGGPWSAGWWTWWR
jgi:hypothetical protein